MEYVIQKRPVAPPERSDWNDAYWKDIPALRVDQFHPKSTDHRPVAQAKLAHSGDAMHVFFHVQDRYVRAVRTELHSPVCKDSCVEFFVQPGGDGPYFNFEINCGGTMLLYFIEDPTRSDRHAGLAKFTPVPPTLADTVTIYPSLPKVVAPERTDPVEWTLCYTVPASLFEHYFGPVAPLHGRVWRANFYKCADETSHPHWASWSPVTGVLNFHQPACFGTIRFA